jgi:SAM-dependent methyltransferase
MPATEEEDMEALIRPEPRAGVRLADFTRDAGTGVHLPPGATAAAGYLDGAEQWLLDELPKLSDRGSGSDELRPLMRDWPSLYHLSPYRATLCDCLGFDRAAGARVLELGAGCGAVTRWLGERFGTVHAVEGSLDRARVARARTADLDTVSLFSANYSELADAGAYDVATLIGVLEYSHLYHPLHKGDAAAAAVANLEVAYRALDDDGILLIAIENRLGLKYLNGAREDHSGRLFEGIQGYVDGGTPVTWSARELSRMVAAAGFASAQFLLPFPDYKLAHTVVNPERCEDVHRIEDWLAGPAADHGDTRGPVLFNESLAVGEIARAGLLTDLANSFLVVAFKGDREAAVDELGLDLEWAARRYSLERRAGLRKRATLRDRVVEHEHAPFGDAELAEAREAVARFGLVHAPAPEAHEAGELLLRDVLRATVRDGAGEELATYVRAHRAWLLERYGVESRDAALVAGEAFDATWWNVVVADADGEWRVIDTEWAFTRPLPVDFLLWRMLQHFLLRHQSELPELVRGLPADEVVAAVLARAGVELGPGALVAFAALEREISAASTAGPLPDGPAQLLDAAVAALAPPRLTVLAMADEVARTPALLRAYGAAVGAGDPVTLVLYAPDRDPDDVAPGVGAALDAAGPAAETADIVLLAAARDNAGERELGADAVAVLTDDAALPAFARLPRVGSRDAGRLRRLIAAA